MRARGGSSPALLDPANSTLGPAHGWLLGVLDLQFHFPGGSPPGHTQSPHLDPRLAEVDQQAGLQPRGFLVVETLGDMGIVQGGDGLHLDHDPAFHDQTGFIVPDLHAVLAALAPLLLDHLDLGLPQVVGQGPLVDLLKEAIAQF